jgi:hypothetical protein
MPVTALLSPSNVHAEAAMIVNDLSRQPAPASAPPALDASRSVTLVWYDVEALWPSGPDAVAEQLAGFFRGTPLTLAWRMGQLGVGSGDSGTEVPVVLLRADPSPGRARALGATRRGGAAPRAIWLFLDPLRATLGQPVRGALDAADARQLARPLARVIAHELVHALAPGHGHTTSGLLKHSFARRELLREPSPAELQHARRWLERREVVYTGSSRAEPERD